MMKHLKLKIKKNTNQIHFNHITNRFVQDVAGDNIYSMKFLNYITALMIKNIRVPGVPEVQNTKRRLDRRSFYQNKYVQQYVVE